jgi:hypothetical protein
VALLCLRLWPLVGQVLVLLLLVALLLVRL